ncbi:hypothetical protein GR7B_00037 [Vibrio phage vB_VcorM_GR7B]|nr:hypothetical protein GR7B_00037 [Vibrio phage vB_VcorM_GR7B]
MNEKGLETSDYMNMLSILHEQLIKIEQSESSVATAVAHIRESMGEVFDLLPPTQEVIEAFFDSRRRADVVNMGVLINDWENKMIVPRWLSLTLPRNTLISDLHEGTPLCGELQDGTCIGVSHISDDGYGLFDSMPYTIALVGQCRDVLYNGETLESLEQQGIFTIEGTVDSALAFSRGTRIADENYNQSEACGEEGDEPILVTGKDVYTAVGTGFLSALITQCHDMENGGFKDQASLERALTYMRGTDVEQEDSPFEILNEFAAWSMVPMHEVVEGAAEDTYDVVTEITQGGSSPDDKDRDITVDDALKVLCGDDNDLKDAIINMCRGQPTAASLLDVNKLNDDLAISMSDGSGQSVKTLFKFFNGEKMVGSEQPPVVLAGHTLNRQEYENELYAQAANILKAKATHIHVPQDQIDSAYEKYLSGVPVIALHVCKGIVQ